MSGIKHPMTFWSRFIHENVKKSSIPKCQELSIWWHFYFDFPWKYQKKLDTQMSGIKHLMTFLSRFFHENVKKNSIPKCHELSLRCHFYLDFSMKMWKKLMEMKGKRMEMKGKWMEMKRKMNGNERKMNGNERKMNGNERQWKENEWKWKENEHMPFEYSTFMSRKAVKSLIGKS